MSPRDGTGMGRGNLIAAAGLPDAEPSPAGTWLAALAACHGQRGPDSTGEALGTSAEAPVVLVMPAGGFGSQVSSSGAQAVLLLLPAAVMRVEFGPQRLIYPTAPNASPWDAS